MSGAGSTAEGWKVICDVKLEEKEEKDEKVSKATFIARKCAKLLTKYLNIKKLQRIFRGTGNYLNELVSKECRERLSRTYREKK